MTKISILTILLAKPNMDTNRLWQTSSEKIAQFLPPLLKGVYDGYSNDNVKKVVKQQLCTCITLYCTFPFRHCRTTTWKCLISGWMKNASKRRQIFLSLGITHSLIHSSSSDPGWDTRLKGIGFNEFHSRRVRPYLIIKRVWIIVLK